MSGRERHWVFVRQHGNLANVLRPPSEITAESGRCRLNPIPTSNPFFRARFDQDLAEFFPIGPWHRSMPCELILYRAGSGDDDLDVCPALLPHSKLSFQAHRLGASPCIVPQLPVRRVSISRVAEGTRTVIPLHKARAHPVATTPTVAHRDGYSSIDPMERGLAAREMWAC